MVALLEDRHMQGRMGVGRRAVRVAVACAAGVAGAGLWAGPALASECPSRATQCQDWPAVPDQGWRQGVVCPAYGSRTVTESVRNLTSNDLTLAVRGIDCWDWSNTGNPSQITGRVLGAGSNAEYRLERSRGVSSRYDLGVFVPEGGGLRLGGVVNVWSEGIDGKLLSVTNTGKQVPMRRVCGRQLLGEDPQRTKSTAGFDPSKDDVITIYSDGTNLYGVRCGAASSGQKRLR
jgi:hypothetical protein